MCDGLIFVFRKRQFSEVTIFRICKIKMHLSSLYGLSSCPDELIRDIQNHVYTNNKRQELNFYRLPFGLCALNNVKIFAFVNMVLNLSKWTSL